MAPEHHLTFGPFRLEMPQGRLWRGDQVIPLRPRSLAMLRLSGRASRPPGDQSRVAAARVGRARMSPTRVLRVWVREIRAALGDAAAAPQYLETVGGRAIGFWAETIGRRPRRARPAPSWGARAKSRPWRGGSSGPPTAPASSSSSVGKRGWARRRWSSCCWPAWAPGASGGRRGASASSTMGRGNRTCPSWKRWGGWAVSPAAGPGGAAAVCADVAGATPRAGERAGAGAAAGPAAGGDAGAHAARARRGARGADGRPAAGAGARRPAVERSLHGRGPHLPGPAAGTGAAAGAGDVSPGGGGAPGASRCAAWCRSCVGGGRGGAAPGVPARRGRGGVCGRAAGRAGGRPPRGVHLWRARTAMRCSW